jgi:hypothetical protein
VFVSACRSRRGRGGYFFFARVPVALPSVASLTADPNGAGATGGFLSFFGFRISRLLRCWPLAIAVAPHGRVDAGADRKSRVSRRASAFDRAHVLNPAPTGAVAGHGPANKKAGNCSPLPGAGVSRRANRKGGCQYIRGQLSRIRRVFLYDLQVRRGLAPLAVVLEVEFELLAFNQTAEAGAVERADMDEHVLFAIFAGDEAKTLLAIVEFYGTGMHGIIPWKRCAAIVPRRARKYIDFWNEIGGSKASDAAKSQAWPK